jgi:hypothetical protein
MMWIILWDQVELSLPGVKITFFDKSNQIRRLYIPVSQWYLLVYKNLNTLVKTNPWVLATLNQDYPGLVRHISIII